MGKLWGLSFFFFFTYLDSYISLQSACITYTIKKKTKFYKDQKLTMVVATAGLVTEP